MSGLDALGATALLETWRDRLAGLACAIVRDPHLADDAVQEVGLALLDHVDGLAD